MLLKKTSLSALFTGVLMLCANLGQAQSRWERDKADSLFSVWKNEFADKEARGSALYKYADGFRRIQPDSLLYFSSMLFSFAEEHTLPNYQAKSRYLAAVAHYDLGKYQRSFEIFDEAIQRFEAVRDTNYLAYSHGMKGNAYKVVGELDIAVACYENAIALFEQSGNLRPLGALYGSLGSIYKNQENYAKASEYYHNAGKLMKLSGRERDLASNYGNLGNLYNMQGNTKKSLAAFNKGMYYATEHNVQRVMGYYLGKLGDAHLDENNIDSAFFYYRSGLRLNTKLQNKKKIVTSYQKIASAFRMINSLDSALFYYDLAYSLSDEMDYRNGQISSLLGLSTIYNLKGEYSKAVSSAQRSRQLVLSSGMMSNMSVVDNELYSAYLAQEKVDSAVYFLEDLIDIERQSLSMNYSSLSEREKVLFFATMTTSFEQLNDLLFQEGAIKGELVGKAYDNALLLKGMMLRSSGAMRKNILSSGDTVLIDKFEYWLGLKEEIAESYAEGKNAELLKNKADSIERLLIQRSDVFSEMQRAMNRNWRDVQQYLGKDEVAIEFVRFHHRSGSQDKDPNAIYSAILINKDSDFPEVVQLCSESELEEVMGDFAGNNLNYIEQLYGEIDQTDQRIYNLIWKPLLPHADGKKKVYYSLDGLLHKIAFSALSDEDGKLLIDKHDLYLLGSTGILMHPSKEWNPGTARYNLYGGVNYDSDSTQRKVWNYLEGTKREVEEITDLLEHKDVDYLTLYGEDASEESFKLNAVEGNVLHIATHGYFFPDPKSETKENEEKEVVEDVVFRGADIPSGYASFVEHPNPLMRSGLTMAGANDVWSYDIDSKNDGVLTAHEVGLMDLRNAELVVLSACETGLGDIKGYEGVYGLQRSFKVAGVKQLIMSLWQVPDKETAEFMNLFYQSLLKNGDVDQAFLNTQRALRKKYDPYYWAAFVLVK